MSDGSDIPRSATDATFDALESAVRSYSRAFPEQFATARGSWLHTRDGKSYLDFLMGCSSLNYGHNHPELKKALIEYIDNDGIAHGLDYYTDAKQAFLQTFSELILEPRGLAYKIQFPGPTGANAVEAALKLARKVTGRHQVVAFTNAFHGVTLGALACTGNRHHRGGAGTPLDGVVRLPYDGYAGDSFDSAALLEQMLADPSSGLDEPAAVIVETVQGEGGLNSASEEWLRDIARITRENGALLIVDDIQAGVGRTGTFFSFEQAGLQPDIVTMAKSLSGYGLPMSLVLIAPDHDIWTPGEHNGTFRGNAHAFVTATRALNYFWRDGRFQKAIEQRAGVVAERFGAMADRHEDQGVAVKGRGMMRGVALPDGRAARQVVRQAFSDGLVVETSGPNDEVIKCLAALNIELDDLQKGLDIIEAAIDNAMREHKKAAA